MPNEQLNIWVKLKDKMSRPLKGMGRVVQGFKKNWLGVTVALAAAGLAIRKLTRTLKGFYSDVLKVSDTVEQMEVKLKVLLGSTEEGAKAFDNMRKLASKVPFEFEEIMQATTDLAGVVDGGNKEIKELMPIIADIAAGTGMKIREVTGQMIRMYSAGAAAADMFRERGVSAALGFEAGVSYSAEETMRRIVKAWEDGTSKYIGATDELAKTWSGTVSMMKDVWFNFKDAIGEDFFAAIKEDLKLVYQTIQNSKEETGEYAKVVEQLRDAMLDFYEASKKALIGVITFSAESMDNLKGLLEFITMLGIGFEKLGKYTGVNWLSEKILGMEGTGEETLEKLDKFLLKLQMLPDASEAVERALEKMRAMFEKTKKSMDLGKKIKEIEDAVWGQVEATREQNEALAEQATLWERITDGIEEGLDQAQEDYHDFKTNIATATDNLVKGLESEFGNFFYNIFTGQLDDALKIFQNFGQLILKEISNIMAKAAAAKMVGGLTSLLGGIFGGGGGVPSGGGVGATPGLGAGFGGFSGGVSTPTIGAGFGGFQTGGDVLSSGGYYLHKGERVVPANEAGGGGRNVTYNIYAVDPQSFQRLLYQNKASIDILIGDSLERNSPLREQVKKYGR